MHEKMTIFAISCLCDKIACSWLMLGQIGHKIGFLPLVGLVLSTTLLVLESRKTELTKMQAFHEVDHTI